MVSPENPLGEYNNQMYSLEGFFDLEKFSEEYLPYLYYLKDLSVRIQNFDFNLDDLNPEFINNPEFIYNPEFINNTDYNTLIMRLHYFGLYTNFKLLCILNPNVDNTQINSNLFDYDNDKNIYSKMSSKIWEKIKSMHNENFPHIEGIDDLYEKLAQKYIEAIKNNNRKDVLINIFEILNLPKFY